MKFIQLRQQLCDFYSALHGLEARMVEHKIARQLRNLDLHIYCIYFDFGK